MSIFNDVECSVRSYCRSFPTTFERASGYRMWDQTGREYLDFFAGAGVLNFGHNNERMTQAVIDYIQSGGVTHSLDMMTTAKRRFMERFENTILKPRNMPHKMQFIGPTGTNAVEAAMKLARRVTGRQDIVAFTRGFHGMTLGSLAWGQVASRLAVPDALLIAAAGALIILPLARRARLGGGATRDLAPSMHWPPPPVAQGLDARPGPVAVTVEYAVPDAARAAFLALMAELAPARRRAGAYTWSLMEDAAEPGRFVESFRDASWTDHLRHHARVTGEDRAVQARIAALLGADAKPAVRHYVMPAAAGAEAPSLP